MSDYAIAGILSSEEKIRSSPVRSLLGGTGHV